MNFDRLYIDLFRIAKELLRNIKFKTKDMDEGIYAKQDQIVEKLKSILEIKHIYELKIEKEGFLKPMLIVILKENCTELTQELSSMVAKIFENETDYLYRIFSFKYAEQQLKFENLFFANGCLWERVISYKSDVDLDVFYKYQVDKKTLFRIEANFQKEREKMAAFMDGASFFIENENFPQATFMLHQYIELWFRFTALFMMGKERKSHSIKELQTFIKAFVPELGNLFNTEIEAELNLLKLLDDAYITTRYENNYRINLEQIHIIVDKASKIESIVTTLFKTKIDACHMDLGKQEIIQESFFSEENPSSNDKPKSNNQLILDNIKKLYEKHYYTLKPNSHRNDVYNINLLTDGYLETSFMITNLLKVCILALESDYISNRLVQQPEHSVSEVLGYILCMMPYEEMEFLDKVRDLLTKIESE